MASALRFTSFVDGRPTRSHIPSHLGAIDLERPSDWIIGYEQWSEWLALVGLPDHYNRLSLVLT